MEKSKLMANGYMNNDYSPHQNGINLEFLKSSHDQKRDFPQNVSEIRSFDITLKIVSGRLKIPSKSDELTVAAVGGNLQFHIQIINKK